LDKYSTFLALLCPCFLGIKLIHARIVLIDQENTTNDS